MIYLGRALVYIICAALLTEGAAIGQRTYERNAPDSFLRFQVESTDELVQVLKTNPVLRRRYARHFGVSEERVVDYVKRALIPYRLPKDRTVTVYGVTRSGRIYGKRTRLRKGTRVWATRSGVPILKWLCANPFSKWLPGEKVARARSQKLPTPRGRVAARPLKTLALPQPQMVAELAPAMPVAPLVTPGVTGSGSALLPAVPGAPVTATAPFVAQLGAPGGGLGALPFAFLPLAFLNTGGGGGTSVQPVQVIPEPGTVALLAASLPALALTLRRRGRKARSI